MAPMKVDADPHGDFTFTRSNGKILGNKCHACAKRKLMDNEDALLIDMEDAVFCLCRYHEGLLLERLITNYLKRRARGRSIGFLEGIPKPKEEATT